MSIFDKLLNNKVENPSKKEIKKLFKHVNPNRLGSAINDFATATRDYRKLNQSPAGRKKLYSLSSDPTIFQVTQTRIDGLSDIKINIKSENLALEDFLKEQILSHSKKIIDHSVMAAMYGFSVFELVWENSGNENKIKEVVKRMGINFDPAIDGNSVVISSINFNKKVEPYGKYLLSKNNDCLENPWGESLYQTIYFMIEMKKFSMDSWAKWLEKFANPFFYGKTCNDQTAIDLMVDLLDGAKDSSAIVTDTESDIKILDGSGSGNGMQFKLLDDCIRKQIHMSILGQNLTTEVATGSLAAANVHETVRQDKVISDSNRVARTIEDLVKYIRFYNSVDPKIVTEVTVNQKVGLNTGRANRDAILVNSGMLSFTEKYISENYNLSNEDFKINDDVKSVGLKFSNNSKIDFKATKEQKELDTLVEYLLSKDMDPIDIDELYSAIISSNNKSELIDQLSQLASENNIDFENLLTQASYYSLSKGVEKIGN